MSDPADLFLSKFEFDLGGQPKDSAEWSTGPCAIRALAIFLGRPWAGVGATLAET